jgi:hypothetical protein
MDTAAAVGKGAGDARKRPARLGRLEHIVDGTARDWAREALAIVQGATR